MVDQQHPVAADSSLPHLATRTVWLIPLVVMVFLIRGQQVPVKAALVILIGMGFGLVVQWALRLAGVAINEALVDLCYKAAALQAVVLFLLDVYGDDFGLYKALEARFGLAFGSLVSFVVALLALEIGHRYGGGDEYGHRDIAFYSLIAAAILFVALYMDDAAFVRFEAWTKEIGCFLRYSKCD